MLKRFLPLFGLFLVLSLPLPAHAAEDAKTGLWEPAAGDIFVVDVVQNIGTLAHATGESITFPVATGRKEFVNYLGRYYNAETPIRTWTAQQKQISGDRRTFGVSGRFLRLYRNGASSSYGIHSYYRIGDWMQEEQRYFSMGCIVVTEEMMDVIEKTFVLNGKKLTVITTDDAEATLLNFTAASGVMSKTQSTLAALRKP